MDGVKHTWEIMKGLFDQDMTSPTVFEALLRALLPLVARLVIVGLADEDEALDRDEDLEKGRVGGPDFRALCIEN